MRPGAPTFVVGTGRCGSTMLSNMLREHPHVLSVSEFFSFVVGYGERIGEAFSPQPIDGRRFWALVAAINPLQKFVYQQHVPSVEQLYPYETPGARFSARTGVPAILHTTLPHLTRDHDLLFETLEDEVATWPSAPIGEQYRRLFGWLAGQFGKRLWIERSGGSLVLAEPLCALFPDARVIHMVRDGRDAALSMCGHAGLRMFFVMSALRRSLRVDPLADPDRRHLDRVPAELRPFLPERFDADAFRAFRLPPLLCGGFWTSQIGGGLESLRALPADRLLTLRYEDFFIDPKQQLDTLAAFLGAELVDDAWSTRAAAMVRKPQCTWRDLPGEDARALTEACRPGFELLAAAGVHYDV